MVQTGFAYNYTISELISAVNTTNTYYNYIIRGIFICWIIILLTMMIYLWFVYLKNLRLRIWRTEGMLSMIPSEIINSSQRMKDILNHKGEFAK